MKFHAIPGTLGQIVRDFTVKDGKKVYILTDLQKDGSSCTVVDLDDLQRNVSTPQNVERLEISKVNLTVVADNLEKYVLSWNNEIAAPVTLKAYFIENIEDVRGFFQDLHVVYDTNFHPDEDFHNFIDPDKQATFTAEEADYLNQIMAQCFDICEKQNVEIYEIGLAVQQDHWRQYGFGPGID